MRFLGRALGTTQETLTDLRLVFRGLRQFEALVGETVSILVAWIAGMSFDPTPVDLVSGSRKIKPLP